MIETTTTTKNEESFRVNEKQIEDQIESVWLTGEKGKKKENWQNMILSLIQKEI